MAQRKTLTEKQVGVLGWIGDGCRDGVMTDEFHRISAAALRSRGLVRISGRGRTWRATITAAGLEYLSQVDGPESPIPRRPNISVTQQLVDDVIAAGGAIRVQRRSWNDREHVDYARRVQIAQRLGKVPDGKRLTLVWHETELEIRLEDAPLVARVELVPVPVFERIGRYHQAAREFRDRSDRHEISRGQLARTVRIVHSLAVDADRRGWEVSVPTESTNRYGRNNWTATKCGHVRLDVAGEHFWLRIQEEGVRTRGPWEDDVERYRHVRGHELWWRDRKVPCGAYDAEATGRLEFVLHAARYWVLSGRRSRFADRQSWTLETRLPHLFREVEERIVELQHYDEAQRTQREREAEQARLAAEERERQWQQLIANARQRLLDADRAAHASRQSQAYRHTNQLREYCDAIEGVHGANSASTEWVKWMRGYADRIDPLVQPPRVPASPTETNEALQQHLPPGWCAEGPEL
jgi:hypothetical protein